jgi:hypothetical protein
MKGSTPTTLYTKETRQDARHVRYWRDVRGSQISLFSYLSRMNHVTRICATSGECQGQPTFVHVKRVTRQVVARSRVCTDGLRTTRALSLLVASSIWYALTLPLRLQVAETSQTMLAMSVPAWPRIGRSPNRTVSNDRSLSSQCSTAPRSDRWLGASQARK